jgi:hypothetical protein
MKRNFISPKRIVWKSEGASEPQNAESLLGVKDPDSCLGQNGFLRA